MIFSCDICGLCCKHLEEIPQLKEYDSGDGSCIYLGDDDRCKIYENRPDICNVKKMYDLFYKDMMDEDDYIQKNIVACKEIKKKYS